MLVYFCSTCGATVPEQNIKSGTAVLTDGDKVFCYKCVTNRSANVSDSKVYRALLAKRSEGGIKNKVRHVSQRLMAQIPTGKFKRVVRRVSERFLGRSTGQHSRIGSSPRLPTGQHARIGSNSRNRLPASSAATLAAVTRKRTEANSLAVATILCVVIALGTLIMFLALGTKKKPVEENTANTTTKPSTPTVAAETKPTQTQPVAQPTPPVTRPVAVDTPKSTTPANTTGTKEVAAPLPPLLTERTGPAAADFKDQLAQERLAEAKAFFKENPRESGLYQKKLNDIMNTYRGTPVAEEAAKLLATSAPAVIAAPKVADSLDWFANWQVDNLYKHAKAKMYEDFDGRKFVLETHPPEADKELRLKWKLPVPSDKPIFEFSARAADNGDCVMFAEIDGQKTPIENLRGAEWRAFAMDLSAHKGKEVTVILHHAPTGWEAENAYWQAPHFSNKADADAKMLVPGAIAATETVVGADWSKAVNLLALVDPLKDSVSGTWASQDGGLGVARALYARTEIPYVPPQEYDLRVSFTRVDGTDNITQVLTHGGKAFAWTMGGAGNTVFGFETIAGVSVNGNKSTIKKSACLENGKKYTSLVQVRDGGVKAFLNGQLITEHKTDYSDMDLYADWKLRDATLLGLGSWNNSAVFHSVELVEVRGQGKALRGEAKAPVAFGDVKIEYERALTDLYTALATKGIKPALERAEANKANPALAPLRSKVELDAEVFGYLLDVRAAALAGAQKLMDNRSFTLTKTDGKDIPVGKESQSIIKEVTGDAVVLEQTLGTSKAIIKLELDDLSAQTQQDLAKLGMPSASQASLKLAMVKLARYRMAPTAALNKDILTSLELAKKDAAIAEKAEHLLTHLSLQERDVAAMQSYKNIETQAKAKNWREVRNATDVFKTEYGNSYAYERYRAQLEQWSAAAEKETVSPLLKR
jgi:hypothetical protein